MAGHFGYQKETYDISVAMAEAKLLPAVRKIPDKGILVADGTSCRHQIQDLGHREAQHIALLLSNLMVEN